MATGLPTGVVTSSRSGRAAGRAAAAAAAAQTLARQPLVRWTLGWMLPPKVSFLKLTQTETTRKLTQETHVAQDFLVPMRDLPKTMDICDTVYDRVYPVWLW